MQKKGTGDTAASTTEEEMTHPLYLTCKRFHDKTGNWPYLNYDNNKIQVNIGTDPDDPNLFRLKSPHGDDIVMPKDRKFKQPKHSPDCNRPVEHAFWFWQDQGEKPCTWTNRGYNRRAATRRWSTNSSRTKCHLWP